VIGISTLQRCEAGATGFEGFRELLEPTLFRGARTSALVNFTQKFRRQTTAADVLISRARLLANDTGIIFRQIQASLTLLL